MLKLFYADAGTLDQLCATVAAIRSEAVQRPADLTAMSEHTLAGRSEFPNRVPLGALGTRLFLGQETAVSRWADRAGQQVSTWATTTDPDGRDPREAVAGLIDVPRR